MAKQSGIVKLKGTIDDISFYKTADGYMARAKGGISRNKILNDPAFQRTRENGMEFGTAGKGGKIIRTAIRHLLQNAKDRRVVPRLTTKLLSIIKTDPVNPRGYRTIENGDMGKLIHFDFNANAPLNAAVYAQFESNFDRVLGKAEVKIEAFVPLIRIAAPQGTTHFRMAAAALEVDFINNRFVTDSEDTGIISFDEVEVAPLVLTNTLTENSTLPVIQVMGVEYFQEVNDEYYPLKNGAHNALGVVNVYTV